MTEDYIEIENDSKDEIEVPASFAGRAHRRVTDEEAASIRSIRAEPSDNDPSRPKYTHSQIAEMFGRTGGMISLILRNKVARDESYVPVFDGHRDHGPRPRDAEGNFIRRSDARAAAAPVAEAAEEQDSE